MQSTGSEATPTIDYEAGFTPGNHGPGDPGGPRGPREPDGGPMRYVPPRPLRMRFTGDGWEYFGIWSVNVLLSVLTLGIYSAWAKVRTMRFFYHHTRLDDAGFDYHGSPTAILKGRAIVFGVALVAQVAGAAHPALAGLATIAVAAIFPLLLVRSLRFRMANTSYRGLRFAFTGQDAGGYKVFMLWPLLAAVSLYTLAPLAHQRLKAYQHNHARFGTTPFSFDAGASQFYGLYLRTFGLSLLAGIAAAAAAGVLHLLAGRPGGIGGGVILSFGTMLVFFVLMAGVGAYFMAGAQNLVWNHTKLGPHAFSSTVKAGPLCAIYATNAIAVLLTLGLFLPFARVRATRYRVESMTLLAAQPLDTFVAGENQQVAALGDAAADWYDIDIAL